MHCSVQLHLILVLPVSYTHLIDIRVLESTKYYLDNLYDNGTVPPVLISDCYYQMCIRDSNQSDNEMKEDTMRLYVAKSRFFKKGDPIKIATDYAVSYTHLDVYKRQIIKAGNADITLTIAEGNHDLIDQIGRAHV